MTNTYLEQFLKRRNLYVRGKENREPVLKQSYVGGDKTQEELVKALSDKMTSAFKKALVQARERNRVLKDKLEKIIPINLTNGGGIIIFNSDKKIEKIIFMNKSNTSIVYGEQSVGDTLIQNLPTSYKPYDSNRFVESILFQSPPPVILSQNVSPKQVVSPEQVFQTAQQLINEYQSQNKPAILGKASISPESKLIKPEENTPVILTKSKNNPLKIEMTPEDVKLAEQLAKDIRTKRNPPKDEIGLDDITLEDTDLSRDEIRPPEKP